MFHWNDTRIEGHICLCYVAYSILTEIQIKLSQQKTPLSENKIRKALDHMQLSEIQQGGEHFYMRSSEKEEVKILESLLNQNLVRLKKFQQQFKVH
jgi:hypothetical protein